MAWLRYATSLLLLVRLAHLDGTGRIGTIGGTQKLPHYLALNILGSRRAMTMGQSDGLTDDIDGRKLCRNTERHFNRIQLATYQTGRHVN